MITATMNMPEYNMLHFIPYSKMQDWSVLRHLQRSFGYSDRFPLVAIGEFLRQSRNEVVVQDETEYKQLTVKTKGGGVCQRTTKLGKDIGTKRQWIVRAGQFVLSKIDARNGAMGIVPSELDGAIVTHDFPLFDVDEGRINPQFLLLITTTASFQRFAQSCSSGTTNRQRINVEKFLSQRIPLPSIEEQNEMVGRYNGLNEEAERKETEILDNKQIINEYFNSVLGYSFDTVPQSKGLKFLRFKNITRWDYQYYNTLEYVRFSYKAKLLKDICTINEQSIDPSKTPNNEFVYIDIDAVENETGQINTNKKMLGRQLPSRARRLAEKGCTLISTVRPNLKGFAYIEDDIPNSIVSTGFAVLKSKDENIVMNKFIYLAFMYSPHLMQQMVTAMPKGQYPSINRNDLENLIFAIPPLSIQQEIAVHVAVEREKAKILQKEAEKLRRDAITEFENKIFIERRKET